MKVSPEGAVARARCERDVAELLRRLPGIEVDDEGGVTYLGKRVDRLLLNGQDVLRSQFSAINALVGGAEVTTAEIVTEGDRPTADETRALTTSTRDAGAPCGSRCRPARVCRATASGPPRRCIARLRGGSCSAPPATTATTAPAAQPSPRQTSRRATTGGAGTSARAHATQLRPPRLRPLDLPDGRLRAGRSTGYDVRASAGLRGAHRALHVGAECRVRCGAEVATRRARRRWVSSGRSTVGAGPRLLP